MMGYIICLLVAETVLESKEVVSNFDEHAAPIIIALDYSQIVGKYIWRAQCFIELKFHTNAQIHSIIVKLIVNVYNLFSVRAHDGGILTK